MLIRADARAIPLRDRSVDCVVTSPPYWGLRDYGAAGQLGLEATPDLYVSSLLAVFGEIRRVLKDCGTVWLNLGDSYATGAGGVGECPGGGKQGESWKLRGLMTPPNRLSIPGLKPKDLAGIPWRVAFALQADGWYLRSDIIWHKPNPMPESVTDRPTKAHEYVFLLAKSERYHYNAAAIREPYSELTEWTYPQPDKAALAGVTSNGTGRSTLRALPKYRGQATKDYDGAGAQNPSETKRRILESMENGAGRNKRSVWTIATEPYAGAHFATMPEALIEPCILAGAPLGGLVLDPFLGSGTVGAVAERLGRRWVGTDLRYHELAKERTAQRGLRFEEACL